jgi:dienelactone hydrolase
MKKSVCSLIVGAFCAVAVIPAFAGQLTAKIGEKYKIVKTDKFAGGERTVFDFKGYQAWVVEPTAPVAEGKPWTWTMQWATAFVPRTPVSKMLSKGWHHVTIDTFKHRMDEDGLKISKEFQDYLVNDLGFAPKTRLIGMSWGGFYSVRYASEHPECVKAMYLDAPLLDFSTLSSFRKNGWERLKEFYPQVTQDYVGADDPMQSVSPARAQRIAKAKIPVLLIYGAVDDLVPAESNCLRFAEAFEKAGGHLMLWRDNLRGHHPHGLQPGEGAVFVNFFNKAK